MSILQSVNGLQSQLASCCCDNRLATCQTQNIIATDGAATRAADVWPIMDELMDAVSVLQPRLYASVMGKL